MFAHRAKDLDINEMLVPSATDLDDFFEKLIDFYNMFNSELRNSTTLFDNVNHVKFEVELLFQNLYRGESIRKSSIDIDYLWDQGGHKASDLV